MSRKQRRRQSIDKGAELGSGLRLVAFGLATALALGAAGPLHAQATDGATTAKPAPPAKTPAKAPAKALQAADDEDAQDDPDVVVTGHRAPLPGAVVGDIEPEIQFSPADIQSFGVSTVNELVNELAPEARSDRGRTQTSPVILLNGHRISSFNEVMNIPTEAILRVDILPEEVALKYGYSADQRVINIVLRPRFRSITGELDGGGSTHGADANGQAEGDQFRVRRDNRLNLDLKYQANGGITYADRGLTPNANGAPYSAAGNVTASPAGGEIDPALSALAGQPVTMAGVPASAANGQRPALAAFVPTAGVANPADTAADRSLTAQTQSLTANAVVARPLSWGINATGNMTLGATQSTALEGLPGVGLDVPAGNPYSPFGSNVIVDRYLNGQKPLEQTAQGWTAHLGSTLNRDSGDWRLSLTDAYDHGDTTTLTGTGVSAAALQSAIDQGSASLDPFGPLSSSLTPALPKNSARAITNSGNIQILANGPLLKLPTGSLYVSAKIGDSESAESSVSQRDGLDQSLSLARNTANARLNLDLPIASRTHHVLAPLGELSLNLNTAIDYLSDFGSLPTLGYGFNWTPVPGYTLQVNETQDHAAPTLAQLDGATIVTPNAPVFDYLTGQTVNVTQISGSNRNLTADSRQLLKIGMTLKPWSKANFSFTANYIDSRIDNAIATFPAASAAIEAAFPTRFIRNAEGELTEEDVSPVNFAREDRQELRWGFNYSRPIGKPPPRPAFDRQAFLNRRRAGADGQPPRGGPGAGGGAGNGQGGPGGADGGASGGPNGGPGGGSPNAGGGSPAGGPGAGGGFGGGGGRGGFGGGGGRGGGGFGAQGSGQFQIAFYHTVIFKDQYLVRPGGPMLDLLGGAPAGGTGGQYQHELEAQLGYTDHGYGLRISADWRSATQVTGGAIGSTGSLDFSDVATINLRLWDDLTQQRKLVMRYRFLRGARITLNVNNLFDQSIKVKDSAGLTPLIYQSEYLNPTGRTISLGLRKLFF